MGDTETSGISMSEEIFFSVEERCWNKIGKCTDIYIYIYIYKKIEKERRNRDVKRKKV